MTTNRMGLTPDQSANCFSDDELEMMQHENNPRSHAFRELLAYRKVSEGPSYFINKVTYGEDIEIRVYCYEIDAMKSKDDFGGVVIPLYAAPPIQAVTVPDEWTDAQCLEFLTVAFRHNRIKGDVEFDDIRLGVKMANDYRPLKSVTNEP